MKDERRGKPRDEDDTFRTSKKTQKKHRATAKLKNILKQIDSHNTDEFEDEDDLVN